jgi:hypothetical protein
MPPNYRRTMSVVVQAGMRLVNPRLTAEGAASHTSSLLMSALLLTAARKRAVISATQCLTDFRAAGLKRFLTIRHFLLS